MKSQIADPQTRALCLRIMPMVADPIMITHYPRDLRMSNGHVYRTASGYEFTGYTANTSMAAAMIDLDGIAGFAGIGRDAIASGVFDNARCYLFACDWTNPIEDYEPIVASILGKTTIEDDRYKIEEMALVDVLSQSVGRTYTPTCPWRFGSAECGVNLLPITVTGTLTSVTSANLFEDSSRAEADDYFAMGSIRFTTGANAGLKEQEIRAYSSGVIETYEPFYYMPQVGDAYSMIPGCRKRFAVDCVVKWNNGVNFGGFPDVPTSTTYTSRGRR
jgi:uncharacterized phage protein (TIGR02218 family)